MNLTAISNEEKLRLQDLLKRSGLKTQVDLVNEALTLYEYLLANLEKGGSLPFQDMGDHIKEIAIGSFLHVQRRMASSKNENENVKTTQKAEPVKVMKSAKQALG